MPYKDPKKAREVARRWHADNRWYMRDWRARLRLEVLEAYGNECACCGETEPKFLTVDHIDGGGNEHRRAQGISGGNQFYGWLRNNGYPKGFRILCHNCNSARGHYGQCPHEEAQ